MLLEISLVLLLPVVLLVLSILIKTAIARRNLKYYELQGIRSFFYPIYGVFGLYNQEFEDNKTVSNLEFAKRISNEESSGVIAVNSFRNTNTTLCVFDSDLIKEFVLKEANFLKTSFEALYLEAFGFFFKNGPEALHERAIFMQIFSYESMVSFTPALVKLFEKESKRFNEAQKVNSTDYVKVNLDELFKSLFERVINIFIFGQEEMSEEGTNKSILQLVYDFCLAHRDIGRSAFYSLFSSLSRKYKIGKTYKKVDAIHLRIGNLLKKVHDQRVNNEKLGHCALDRFIQYNRNCKKEGKEKEILNNDDLRGIILMMIFAGTDTSQNSIKMALCALSGREDIKELFVKINQDLFPSDNSEPSGQDFENNVLLEMWTKEALRVFPAPIRSFPRLALKDTKLSSKVTVRKGDYMILFMNGLNFNENLFPDHNKFQIERFTEEKEKSYPKYQNIPFAVGKRRCLGIHMAQTMLKVFTTLFYKTYDFKKPDDVEYYIKNVFMSEETKPFLDVKLKTK